MTEIPLPMAVRRKVSFCEAVYDGQTEIEWVKGKLVTDAEQILKAWEQSLIPVIVDPEAKIGKAIPINILVDAILAKKNVGTKITDAPLVIGIGPGFEAGKDVHTVVESNRGHNLGRVILSGKAEEDTGIPGSIGPYSIERVLRAPKDGCFHSAGKNIGDSIGAKEITAYVNDEPIIAQIDGVLRGLLRDGAEVVKGMKLGDIDPRGIREYCFTISDKARAIAGGVLEGILLYLQGSTLKG
jgi:xanthine dehydrogenase accessory factor